MRFFQTSIYELLIKLFLNILVYGYLNLYVHTNRELGLEYVDLYLIHWPLKMTQEVFQVPIPKECIFAIDIKGVWEAMEECVDQVSPRLSELAISLLKGFKKFFLSPKFPLLLIR